MPIVSQRTLSAERQNVHTIVLVWVIIAGMCAFLANVIAAQMMTIG